VGSSRYGKRTFRAPSSCTNGASENRTDFGEAATGLLVEPRRDFLRNEDDDVTRGCSEALAKSLEREGSFGWEMVEEVVSVGVPWNCDARSLYCFIKACSVSERVRDVDVSPASSNRIRSFVTASSPSRRESSDLEMCPSCEVGSRFSDIARCLSRRDNLM